MGQQSLVRSGGLSPVAQNATLSPLQWTLPCRGCASDHAQPWAELAALKCVPTAQAESLMMLVHELRSPVAASKSMVATLRYLNREDIQLDGLLARIENRMDQLLDLVSDILNLFILSNLISNAVKYTPAGSVSITLRPEEA